MKKQTSWSIALVLLGGWGHIALAADVVKPETPLSVPTVAATPIPGGSGIQNSQDFELEKLRLEKQKLELEVEKMRLQTGANAQSAAPPKREKSYDKNLRKIEQEELRRESFKQSQALAQQHKDEADLLVVDFTNGQVWYKGVPYGAYEWEMLAENQGWKVQTTVVARDVGGHARKLYRYQNGSILRYEGRDRGIWTLEAPASDGDLRVLMTENLSFQSRQEDFRSQFTNGYLVFEKQRRDKNGMMLRYKQGGLWKFAEKLEVYFDKDGRMSKIRYGILDEH